MDLFDVLKACIRRWYIFVPIIAITAAIGYMNYSSVKPVYYARTSISLAGPSVKFQPPATLEGQTISTNGLIDAGGVSLLANILASVLSDGPTREQVSNSGGTASYSAFMQSSAVGAQQIPVLTVQSSGSNPQSVARTLQLAVAQAGPVLKNIQAAAQVPTSTMFTVLPVTNLPEPVGSYPSRTRKLGSTLVGGLLVAVIASAGVDAAVEAVRRRRRSRDDATEPTIGAGDTQPAPGNHRATDTPLQATPTT